MESQRVLPHNLEAEAAVLEAILRDNGTLPAARAVLSPPDFFRDAHKFIFGCMCDMADRGVVIEEISLCEELARIGKLESVGGPGYVGGIVTTTRLYRDAREYVTSNAQTVAKHARRRTVIFDLNKATQSAYANDPLEDIAAQLHGLSEALPDTPDARAAQEAYLINQETSRERARREARRRVDLQELGGSDPPVFQRLDALLRADIPPVEYVIDRLQPKGSKVLFAAQAKAGKTTTVLNLIRSLVDGVPFLGQFNAQAPAGNVCLIDLEMSASQLPRWFKDADINNADRVRVVQLRGRARDFNLLDPNVLARWAADLKRENVGYLIFDNLRPLLDSCGLDENKDAGRFLVLFDRLIAEAGISASMIIHHMGHNGDRSRGDSRLRDWPDVEWKLTRQRNAAGEVDDPNSPRFFSCYGRDVHQAESQLEFDAFRRHLTMVGGNRREAVLSEAVVQLYDLLEGQQLSQRGVEDACKAAGLSIGRDTIREALSHGAKSGALVHSKGPRNSDQYGRGPHPPLRGTARAVRGTPDFECAGSYREPRTRAVEVNPISARVESGGVSHVEL